MEDGPLSKEALNYALANGKLFFLSMQDLTVKLTANATYNHSFSLTSAYTTQKLNQPPQPYQYPLAIGCDVLLAPSAKIVYL